MAKFRNLKGIPHNITKSFLDIERKYNSAYMGDWIANIARRLKVSEVTIDVMNGTTSLDALNITPLLTDIKDLKRIIAKELAGNGFPDDYIVEAKIKIVIPEGEERMLHCYPYIVDKTGRKYEGERITEISRIQDFDPFDPKLVYPNPTWWQKIRYKLLGR